MNSHRATGGRPRTSDLCVRHIGNSDKGRPARDTNRGNSGGLCPQQGRTLVPCPGVTLPAVTGPPAVGKSTAARSLASTRPRCAVVEVDDLRRLVLTGAAAPWDGEAGARPTAARCPQRLRAGRQLPRRRHRRRDHRHPDPRKRSAVKRTAARLFGASAERTAQRDPTALRVTEEVADLRGVRSPARTRLGAPTGGRRHHRRDRPGRHSAGCSYRARLGRRRSGMTTDFARLTPRRA